MSPYPEELNNFCLVLFLQCAIVSVPPPSPPSPFVCCSSVWVCLCVCVCIHFFERVKALCEAPVFFHMQISHIGPSTQAFTWTCYWSSASWQNPLVQRGWLTGHQLLSAGTKLTGCRCCWLGWGLEGPVYSGRVRAVSKQTEVFFCFVLFFFVNQVFEFWHSVSLESCLPHRANHASPTWVQCGLQIRVPSGFFSWVPWWPHLCLPTYAERMIHK